LNSDDDEPSVSFPATLTAPCCRATEELSPCDFIIFFYKTLRLLSL